MAIMSRMLDERKLYKLRTKPEDFVVEELLEKKVDKGRYALYILEKRSLTTLDAIKIISKTCDVPFRAIGFAGMKDKHAVTRQHITVPRKYTLSLDEPNMDLRFIGYTDRPLVLGAHVGNKFTITLRKMRPGVLERIHSNAAVSCPVPNYFDSQRFGMIKGSGEFPAVRIMKGDYEGALRLLMTRYYRKERSHVKKLKKFLGEHWGEWGLCREFLEKGRRYENFHKIVSYMEDNPGDYRNAIRLFRSRILELIVTSFQSYLWNEALKFILMCNLGENRVYRVKYAAGHLLFIKKTYIEDTEGSLEKYAAKSLELPHPKNRSFEAGIYSALLNKLSLATEDMRRLAEVAKLAKPKRKMFFKVDDLKVAPLKEGSTEEAVVSFTVPPGSYATVLLKNLLE